MQEISNHEKLELEELKERVRKMLMETPDNSAQKLLLIDTIQRLGALYHFYNEFKISLIRPNNRVRIMLMKIFTLLLFVSNL
ncbi:hypothetical protein T459_16848 [Capsicum annuum]|uniref:Terpene synthase N-terminal domain-containing protein n=1 Tax=Capsicum annuum TaxID=4072 RepID=A0A2G2Z9W3_CAPAN|nr:hypothetical protein T459_16848 [Capsicum annuum]